MVQMKKRTRADKGKRRSHHALKALTINQCSKCSKPVEPHKACPFCGAYRLLKGVKTKATAIKSTKK